MGQRQPIQGRTAMAASAGRPAVILVEDEVLVRQLLAEHLRDVGCTVYEARDAQEAMALMAGGVVFNAVVTDVQMPGPMASVSDASFVRPIPMHGW